MAAISPVPVTDSVCYLCTSPLKDSVVLRCCHSLCKNCLQSYWELNKSLKCPVCLRDTHCSVLLHHLSISHFASEDESSQDSDFKPPHVANAESGMVSELNFHSKETALLTSVCSDKVIDFMDCLMKTAKQENKTILKI